nr:MAG TPA: Proprotein convertase subtilisin-like/kexin type 9 C-terminal domain [Caudoviricetes sp.]
MGDHTSSKVTHVLTGCVSSAYTCVHHGSSFQ